MGKNEELRSIFLEDRVRFIDAQGVHSRGGVVPVTTQHHTQDQMIWGSFTLLVLC